MIAAGGTVRGAIAFGLALQIGNKLENDRLIKQTVQVVVLFTTVVIGSLMEPLSKSLMNYENQTNDSELLLTEALLGTYSSEGLQQNSRRRGVIAKFMQMDRQYVIPVFRKEGDS